MAKWLGPMDNADPDPIKAPIASSDPVAAEQAVLQALARAHTLFLRLPPQHPDEGRDWTDALHRLQDLLAVRVARAYRPDLYPVKRPSPATWAIDDPPPQRRGGRVNELSLP